MHKGTLPGNIIKFIYEITLQPFCVKYKNVGKDDSK
jgi:hypothetical protein